MRLSNPATHISTIFLWESIHFQTRAKRRKNLTLADAIFHYHIIQPTLPQSLIGNHLTFFLAREIHASRLACPTNVVLLRFKRVWNNVETMIDIICALRKAFDPHIDRVQPISILNAAAIHLGGVSFCLMFAGCGVYMCCLQKLYNARRSTLASFRRRLAGACLLAQQAKPVETAYLLHVLQWTDAEKDQDQIL